MSQLGVAPSGERLRKKAIYGVICTEVGLGPGDIVLDADPAPAQKGTAPQFSAHVYCGQTAGWTKMSLSMEASLGSGDFVFDGDPAPLPKKGTAPTQFLVHVYCGQTAGWIKMPLGTEVNLGPGDVVLDGDPAPLQPPSSFRPMSIVATVAHLSYTAELLLK